jgi:hypothetical protein
MECVEFNRKTVQDWCWSPNPHRLSAYRLTSKRNHTCIFLIHLEYTRVDLKRGVKLLTKLNPPKDQTVVKTCRGLMLIKGRVFDNYLAVVPTVQSAFDV